MDTTNSDILQWVRDNINEGVVQFPDDMLRGWNAEQAELLAREYGADVMVHLPESEVHFFEWLRRADPAVWEDLWLDDIQPRPYVVGMALLPQVLQSNRGFPICDLVHTPNFYFTHKHVRGDEAKPYLEVLRARLEEGESLDIPQLLLLEITQEPIDIWRFAYLYRVPLAQAKQAVVQLVEDDLLLYTPTREELSDYLVFPQEDDKTKTGQGNAKE